MITASIWNKQNLLDSAEKRQFVRQTLLKRAEVLGWKPEAWPVLSNHYHRILRSPDQGMSLTALMRSVHSITAKYVNRIDRAPGRRVWHNYWDSCISHEGSYIARLHYVHTNAVRHGLVRWAEDSSHCSYRWFLGRADAEFRKRVLASPIGRLAVRDDF